MLVLANGQSNLLRVPGGAGRGVALDLDAALRLLLGVPVAPGDGAPTPPASARPVGCPSELSVGPITAPPTLLPAGTDAAGPHAASRAMAPIDQAKTRPGVRLKA
jgi:hypothetical protein